MPTFDETLDQVRELLQKRGRLSYRALKRRFELDDEYLEDLKEELIKAERVAVDEDGAVLVWTGGDAASTPSTRQPASLPSPVSPDNPSFHPQTSPQADRRQLTVRFCDLVGSTPMSAQLDPEDYRDIMQAYQEMCGQVLTRFTGHIARYEGDGILVYFGYPQAQEDAAAQAVRSGLQIIAGLPSLNARFQPCFPLLQERPLQVRIGLHTGLVVVGEMGSEQYRIDIAVGETPNMAARIQGQAGPNEIMISAATYQLVEGLFACRELEERELKGITTPQAVYQVTAEGQAQSRFEVAMKTGLTPLVGREHELGVLRERWVQAQAGNGQAVLVGGEPGIGKSRLVQELKAQATDEGATPIEFRCSPYYQNSALYPIIAHLQRLLQFTPNDTPKTKLIKLQELLGRYRFPQADTLPLLARLLSLPHPEGVSPVTVSPQKQKELTYGALVAWLLEESERQAVYNVWEDLHWADPSTLEVLDLLLTQVPTTRLLAVLTFRPEFVTSWGSHSYMNQVSLSRLGQSEASAMVAQVTGSKALPQEVVQQIVTKTDGVPLFVEELTKMVVESRLVHEVDSHYELTGSLQPLAIPATLQDSLMARLDRLAPVKEVAQLGATIGREFGYDLLQAISPLTSEPLQQALQQLVDAELVFQRGLPPQARYTFKHALIQDTAYASLLKSRRQHYHHQIALVLEDRFPETVETQPELVAHHYTEAGLVEQAIPYWQQAGRRAAMRSANSEAISHFSIGLELLKALPDSPERTQQELTLLGALAPVLMLTKGWAAPEVKAVYTRREELSKQMGETPELFSVVFGQYAFYFIRGEHPTGLKLAERLLRMAQNFQDTSLLLVAHVPMLFSLLFMGKFAQAHEHCEEGIAIYDPKQHHALAFVYNGFDLGEACLSYAGLSLFALGCPDQARKRMAEALGLARQLSHPFTLAHALFYASRLHFACGEIQLAQEEVEEVLKISADQGFALWAAQGTIWRGYLLAVQGQGEEGMAQIGQGLDAYRPTGSGYGLPISLASLATAHVVVGQVEEGLAVLAEGLAIVNQTEERWYEAEFYHLKGELTLQAGTAGAQRAAEAYFQQSIDIARRQEAKSFELRAATSLARLWQQQGKTTEARDLLAPVYDWFTEGFDTKDLQEAKALLEGLA